MLEFTQIPPKNTPTYPAMVVVERRMVVGVSGHLVAMQSPLKQSGERNVLPLLREGEIDGLLVIAVVPVTVTVTVTAT